LPGDPPEAYGVLMCARSCRGEPASPRYEGRLLRNTTSLPYICVEVGGGSLLTFSEVPRTGDLPKSAIEA
jgi:hypothetical protein